MPACCSHTNLNCPVDATIRLIGGKYKALILWHLVGAPLRFGALKALIPQATPKMLTQQLRELEADRLITRTVYPEVPPHVEYALTDFGLSLKAVLDSMYRWGEGYMADNQLAITCSMSPPDGARGSAKQSSTAKPNR
ncbi:MAG: helix-turn-helix transcriptional regulator [Coriobacteriales bacterium]|jgi:DNA-binding HxlR family transcriptional regulator|nr:helix-turn-helix transcriptional regulator [Coriobacteriales bacterium]